MSSKAPADGEWRAATDQKSGRTYYYHTKTKATTWSKPLELASPEERRTMIEQKEKTLAFFKEMENNIMNKIKNAAIQDEHDRERRRNRTASVDDEEDGFYYLDEREGSYELNDAKEVGIVNRNVRFSQTSNNHSLDTMKVNRVLVRTTSSGSADIGRESLTSFDAGVGHYDPKMTGRTRKNSFGGAALVPPRRMRTISTIDDDILLTMRRGAVTTSVAGQVSGNMSGEKRAAYYNAPANTTSNHDPFLNVTADNKDKFGGALNLNRETSKEIGDRLDARYPVPPADVNNTYLVENMNLSSNPAKKPRTAPQHKRRNSTGTIFLANTMSNQDNNATIECVCVVIRAHMLDAAKENVTPLPEYDVFKDASFQKKGEAKAAGSTDQSNVPSLSTVKDFFQYLFSKSQLESDTIIMALIYCERLVKETKGKLCIRYDNWRSILFACLVMASKVWDDLSMWNVDFSQVYPSFDLRRVNTLELAMLDALKYVIRVSASEYAKYYFYLRSMMARLGLYTAGEPNLIRPLDLAGARKLQLSTEKYLEQCGASVDTTRRRFYSVHETTPTTATAASGANKAHTTVGLEQLVGVEHMDADGQVHTSRKLSSKTDSKSPKKPSSHSSNKEYKEAK